MISFTAEEIQAKFEQLPKNVQDAITSTEVHDSIIAIAKKNGLHIDQEGDLVDQVGLVMLGLSPSRDFVKNLSSVAGIRNDIASSIAEDINTQIFSEIRRSMREIEEKGSIEKIQSKNNQSISALERLGNFNIEKPIDALDHGTEHIESKDEVIDVIESPTAEMVRTDTMLIDHLLAGPVVSVEKKTVVNAPEEGTISNIAKPTVAPTGNKGGSDLYREPIN